MIQNKSFLFQQTELRVCFLPQKDSKLNSESLLLFLFHGKKFWVVFSSAEWLRAEFRKFAFIFVLRNGIPSCFLFRGMVGTEFQKFASFYSMEWNSELVSRLRKVLERNSEKFDSIFVPRKKIPSCLLFLGMVWMKFRRVCFYFCSMEQNSDHFSPRWMVQNGIPRVFCFAEQPNNFLYENANPTGE